MLKRLLYLLEEGNAVSTYDLAKEMDIPESLVSQMLTQLVRLGYLNESSACQDACHDCSLSAGCYKDNSMKTRVLARMRNRTALR